MAHLFSRLALHLVKFDCQLFCYISDRDDNESVIREIHPSFRNVRYLPGPDENRCSATDIEVYPIRNEFRRKYHRNHLCICEQVLGFLCILGWRSRSLVSLVLSSSIIPFYLQYVFDHFDMKKVRRKKEMTMLFTCQVSSRSRSRRERAVLQLISFISRPSLPVMCWVNAVFDYPSSSSSVVGEVDQCRFLCAFLSILSSIESLASFIDCFVEICKMRTLFKRCPHQTRFSEYDVGMCSVNRDI